MAFKSVATANIGTGATIVSDTVSSSTTHTVIGFSVSNIVANAITITASLSKNGGNTAYLVKSATVASGGTIVIVGGDQKVVLEEGDTMKVLTDTATSADAIVSYLSSST
jgi:hypothetical protein|tara:strand:- start:629 stop:958 length:330 start_codon:yes stop_codon:yes gene_type:complete